MRLIKIAIASVNTTVGAIRSNTDRVIRMAEEMASEDVTLACFPEQTIGGYPPEDLIQWRRFVDGQKCQLARFAAETAEFPTVLVVGVTISVGAQLFNCAAILHRGKILGLVPKEKLPTYEVFYEARTFSHGGGGMSLEADGIPLGDFLFEFDFGTVAAEVCEDTWSPDGPTQRRCYSGAEVVVNASASPYRIGMVSTRREMFATRSADNQAVLAYANAVGSQDGLIFDGGGYVLQNGRMVLDAPRMEEGWWSCVVDLDRTRRLRQENTTWREDANSFQQGGWVVPVIHSRETTADRSALTYPIPNGGSFFLPPDELPTRSPRDRVLDDLFEILALGVEDYFTKTAAFRTLGVAVSGGRDSVLTLLVAWRAAQRIHRDCAADELARRVGETLFAFYMPSKFSGSETRRAAETICRDLGISLQVVSIDEAMELELQATRDMLGGEEPDDITQQNIQARIRAERMWNWANSAHGLFLQPGDMSERAVGYTTIGGDLEGGLSVIANVPKTVVIAMLNRLYERFGFEGIAGTLETPPGPELKANQQAEDELMPFSVLDACLRLYAGEKLALEEIEQVLPDLFPEIDRTQLAEWARVFVELFTRSIYKWVQAPLSLHVGSLDLERERALQLPVVQRNEWNEPSEG